MTNPVEQRLEERVTLVRREMRAPRFPQNVNDCWCDFVADDVSHWDEVVEGDQVPYWDRHKDRHRCGHH